MFPPQEDFAMKETTSRTQTPNCPYCGGKQFFRSRRSGVKDWFRHVLLFQNPYRCAACDGRFFRFSYSHHHKNSLEHRI
jgi:DNA-directed RNA polymerase subunit RPC12/RpoP